MTPTEYRQRRTDDQFARHEVRQANLAALVEANTLPPMPPAKPKPVQVETLADQLARYEADSIARQQEIEEWKAGRNPWKYPADTQTA